MTGFGGGIAIKRFLLAHEDKFSGREEAPTKVCLLGWFAGLAE